MGLAAQREELEKKGKQETVVRVGVLVTAKMVTRQGWFERKAGALLMTEYMVPVWLWALSF